ncbi:hypothetical protein [Streptomyces sp. V1I1]|uniref:hypothetical protein n=1 Tax=Streptomyces sp. V1I1 TaxID=3042272 RepID=UPI00278991E7|nr:hypothetical protein [Streptomyces sp. V1I1]MDQ0938301.1 hypothetical protein [Streptomyces sp. V1I1]MDQ0946047.1 hypothetical protein [Streptomyces sp. V1I1]MDQ0946059.1 hypothetical protein [Streptomyces sp. V1I1]
MEPDIEAGLTTAWRGGGGRGGEPDAQAAPRPEPARCERRTREGLGRTLGCVVFDKMDGTPYVLSNWHVLHGPDGELGDDVVEPGPHDDNRIAQNRLGTLKRSHLGMAGDCSRARVQV